MGSQNREPTSRSSYHTSAATLSRASAYVVRTYSFLAAAVFLLFGSLHILNGQNSMLGVVELLASGAMAVNGAFVHSLTLAKNLLLTTMLLFIGIMLVTGGTHDAGIFWLYVFPIGAFFVAGRHEGLHWMAAVFTVIAAVAALAGGGMIDPPYDTATLALAAASLSVLTGGMYIYQQAREHLMSQTLESKAKLHTERQRADIIVSSLSEGVVTTDAEGNVTFMNKAAEKILGWHGDELLGKSFIDHVPMLSAIGGKVIEPAERPLRHVFDEKRTVSMRVIYRRKDGKPVPVALIGTPLITHGKVSGVIGTLRDTRDEEDVIRAKSEFVTLASHQLRTPISAISWVSELLLGGDAGKLTPEQHEHVAGIYKSNQRLAGLVSEMLIVSSLDLQSLPVMPEKIDIAAVAAAIVKDTAATQGKQAHHITEHYSSRLPQIACDPQILKLLLGILISNAFKYTPAGGTIKVKIDTSHEKLHPASKGSLVCTISDTGYGIPASAYDKIFSKFFRGENIKHKDTDGTGLGLYLVKEVLQYVGGRIDFTSKEGAGSVFTLRLPLEGMSRHDVPGRQTIWEPAKARSSAAHV